VEFEKIQTTSDLGPSLGLVGFARQSTWGKDAAPRHTHSHAVSAQCVRKDFSSDEFILADQNRDGKIDIKDLGIFYIDFDRM